MGYVSFLDEMKNATSLLVAEIGAGKKSSWDGTANMIYLLSLTSSWRAGFAQNSATFLIWLRAEKSHAATFPAALPLKEDCMGESSGEKTGEQPASER